LKQKIRNTILKVKAKKGGLKMNKSIILLILLIVALVPAAFSASEFANIKVTLLSQQPDPAYPGEIVEVRFKVENNGKSDYSNAYFEILPESPFTLAPGDSGIREPGKIIAGQTGDEAYVILYRLKVLPDAVEGSYEVRLRYSNDETNYKTLDPFTLNVATRNPILAITSVTTEPEIVGIGDELTLSIGLENIADSYIKNIKVNLQLVEAVSSQTGTTVNAVPFAPIGSSNEKVVKLLEAGKQTMLTFKLICDVNAEPQVYKIPTTLTYEDDNGKEHTKSTIVSVKVGQEPDLLVILDNNDPFIIGKTDTLSVRFINKGLIDVKLLTAEIVENEFFEVLSSKISYIGNIDSDDYETTEFTIKCKSCVDGKIPIPLSFEFLDANNHRYTKQIELSQKVYSPEKAIEEGLEKKSNIQGYLIAVGIVILGIVVYRIFRNKKKK
jgi:hypothetical protein